MQQRLGGAPARAAAPVFAASLRAPLPCIGVILGVDPSLRGTGYGVIRLGQTASGRARARHHLLSRKTGNAPAASPKFRRRCAT